MREFVECVEIACDGCGALADFKLFVDWEAPADQNGWATINGEDFCPSCVQERSEKPWNILSGIDTLPKQNGLYLTKFIGYETPQKIRFDPIISSYWLRNVTAWQTIEGEKYTDPK